MRYIPFYSVAGLAYNIQIEDGSQDTTEMVAGPQPFVTDMDDDDDPFCPIRTMSGNIQIEGAVSDILDLVESQPKNRKVELRGHNSQGAPIGIVWQGFLQTRAYSQSLDRAPIYISLPVISCLEMLRSYYPSGAESNMGYRNFASIINEANNILVAGGGYALWSMIYFPSLTNPMTTLYYNFPMKNYADWNESENKWQPWSYFDIIEDICKLFGWQCQEHGTKLVFSTFDSMTSYSVVTAAQLASMAANTTVTGTTVNVGTDTETIWGADHRLDIVNGKSKITVTGDVNVIDETVWELDLDNYEPGSNAYHDKGSADSHTIYYTRNYPNDEVSVPAGVSPANGNFKYNAFVAGTQGVGANMVSDRILETSNTGGEYPRYDSGWKDHLIYRTDGIAANTVMFSIKPKHYFFWNKLMDEISNVQNKWWVLNMNFQYCRDPWDFMEDSDDYAHIKINVGSITYLDTPISFKGGKVVYMNGWKLTQEGFGMNVPANNGQITIEITSDTQHSDIYYAISDLSLKFADDWRFRSKWQEKTENKETQTIEGGYDDEYNVDFKLTTYRKGEFGWGIIMGRGGNDAVPTVLYSNKTPEKALVDRLAAYYGQSRRQVVMDLKVDGQMLYPFNKHYVQNAGTFACLSQSVDWANDTVTARMAIM